MDKLKAGYVEGIASVAVNTILFVLKMWVGIVTGSIALTADAWHTLSDSLSSVVVIIATRLSSQKADKEHPFGHGRWEQIAALFIAFLLGVIAYDFLRDSIVEFVDGEAAVFGVPAIVVTVVSVVVKEALAQYAFRTGRATGNASVIADGWHHRTDALSSVVVLAGILLAGRFWWIDSVLGGLIALTLFYAAYRIAMESIVKLLGEEPDAALTERITDAVKTLYGGDLRLHHFHIHNYVRHRELTFHIKLDNNLSILEGHRIATEIERMIRERFGIIATIHVEPLDFHHSED
ncbi:MAG: cation diffusion facilitator family transporter [Tannerellaceae bacterium]|jgi:cation diffusion facilitator family transporter|nr:cation diffusion facilitator family transporter [Tannerellaceae bacterium]